MRPLGAVEAAAPKFAEDLHLRVVDGVGKVIALHLPHICFMLRIIETFHVILAGFVQINGFLVERIQRRGK